MDRLLKKYEGRVRLEIYHMPWSNKSKRAAEAALCAGEQGKFWEFHQILFDQQKHWPKNVSLEDSFLSYARILGLDEKEFASCLQSHKMERWVIQNKNYGKSLHIHTTPTVFINHTRIVGTQSMKTYEKAIEREFLRKKRKINRD